MNISFRFGPRLQELLLNEHKINFIINFYVYKHKSNIIFNVIGITVAVSLNA